MISFDDFRGTEGVPIYLQMIRYVRQGLAAGTIRQGDELPSRRLLSATLAVNPNTVQKAYHLLEEDGLITSRPGAASYVCATAQQVAAIRSELYREELQGAVRAMKRMGLCAEDAAALLRQLYEEVEA